MGAAKIKDGGKKTARELRGKDIGHNNRFLLLDSTEWIFLLVFPRMQSIIPQLWKTAETEERPENIHCCINKMSIFPAAIVDSSVSSQRLFCCLIFRLKFGGFLNRIWGQKLIILGIQQTERVEPEVMSMLCLSSSSLRIFSSSSLCTVSNSSSFSLWEAEMRGSHTNTDGVNVKVF